MALSRPSAADKAALQQELQKIQLDLKGLQENFRKIREQSTDLNQRINASLDEKEIKELHARLMSN